MIHKLADVQSKNIGKDTRIWQFCVVLPGAKIGENCNICTGCYIENQVVVGNNVTIKNGVYLWDGVTIEDNVQIGANVNFINDNYPRAKQPFVLQHTLVKSHASIGVGATLKGGIIIGEYAMIGAGSVVTKNVPAGELWVGNPARFVKKIDK